MERNRRWIQIGNVVTPDGETTVWYKKQVDNELKSLLDISSSIQLIQISNMLFAIDVPQDKSWQTKTYQLLSYIDGLLPEEEGGDSNRGTDLGDTALGL